MVGGLEAAADLASGAIMAHAVSSDGGDGELGHGKCPNCETPLIGAFCYACGQPAHLHRTATAIGHEIAHGVFHLEGRTWHTLPLLAWRPGELTRRYVHGQRARFNSPLALFLFSVFLMFAVFHAVSPFGSHDDASVSRIVASGKNIAEQRIKLDAQVAFLETARNKALAQGNDIAVIDQQLADVRKRELAIHAVDNATNAAASIDSGRGYHVDIGIPWLDRTLTRASKNPDLLIYKLQSNAYKYSWLLIPISLPFIWLMFFWWRDVTLYDHAIFAIHSLSFMTLFVVLLSLASGIGIGGGWIPVAAMLVPPIHMYRHLKGAYLLTRLGALWRTWWLLCSASVCAILFVIAIVSMGIGD